MPKDKVNNPQGKNQHTGGAGAKPAYKYSVGGYFATQKKNLDLQAKKFVAESDLRHSVVPTVKAQKAMLEKDRKESIDYLSKPRRSDVSPDHYPSIEQGVKSTTRYIKSMDESIAEHSAVDFKNTARIKEADAYKPVADKYLNNLMSQTKTEISTGVNASKAAMHSFFNRAVKKK